MIQRKRKDEWPLRKTQSRASSIIYRARRCLGRQALHCDGSKPLLLRALRAEIPLHLLALPAGRQGIGIAAFVCVRVPCKWHIAQPRGVQLQSGHDARDNFLRLPDQHAEGLEASITVPRYEIASCTVGPSYCIWYNRKRCMQFLLEDAWRRRRLPTNHTAQFYPNPDPVRGLILFWDRPSIAYEAYQT
jgi:hypothetical protein